MTDNDNENNQMFSPFPVRICGSGREVKMTTLGNPTNTIAVLRKYGIHFQKKYGQNFLVDANILENIVKAAEITGDDCVLEIGPGIGTMTQYLCERAREVVAVEIDKNLIPVLEQDTLAAYRNITVINDDILKVDINAIVQEKNGGRPVKIVANLPYYITTPIIMGLFERHIPLESITIMVQKEVAQRMQAGPGTKDYGALSLAVQYYAEAQALFTVPAACFMPRPNVDSAVIKLTSYQEPPVAASDEKLMFGVIRAAFNQRRKTLVNSLSNAAGLSIRKEDVLCALRAMELADTVRGEALTLAEFARLADILKLKMAENGVSVFHLR